MRFKLIDKRPVRTYAYVAWTLLREVHDQVAPPDPSGQHGHDDAWAVLFDEAFALALADQPLNVIRAAMEREEACLVESTRQHLEDKSKAPEAAQPGDYLYLPDIRLAANVIPGSPVRGTAVALHGTVNNAAAGQTTIVLVGPAEFLRSHLRTQAILELARLPDQRDLLGMPLGIQAGLPFPSTPADLDVLLRILADREGMPAGNDRDRSPAGAVAALAQRLNCHLAPEQPAKAYEVMARVLIREAGSPPFGTVIVGVPLWAMYRTTGTTWTLGSRRANIRITATKHRKA